MNIRMARRFVDPVELVVLSQVKSSGEEETPRR